MSGEILTCALMILTRMKVLARDKAFMRRVLCMENSFKTGITTSKRFVEGDVVQVFDCELPALFQYIFCAFTIFTRVILACMQCCSLIYQVVDQPNSATCLDHQQKHPNTALHYACNRTRLWYVSCF